MSHFRAVDSIPLVESHVSTCETFIDGGAETAIMADVVSQRELK